MRHLLLALTLLLAIFGLGPLAVSAIATPPPPPIEDGAQRSLAGGYRALTICSALFSARRLGAERSVAHVAAHELAGVYPELQPFIQDGSVVVGDNHVLVRWADSQPPSIAYWQPAIGGCALLRPGSAIADALSTDRPGPQRVAQPLALWPVGDEGALVPATVAVGQGEPWPVIRSAIDGQYGDRTNTTAMVIIADGRIAQEYYAAGFDVHTPQRTWSVAKSLAVTVIGAAVQRGEIDVNARAAIAQWPIGDPRRTITINQLLRMSSGLTSDTAGNRTDAIYFGGATVDQDATRWPVIHQPGTVYRYANNDTLLATLAIAPTFVNHPPRAVFASVDMHATIAETDWRGNYILSSQVWSTARDLARFGMLYLNNGVWQGRRILPENWRTYVTTPSGPQPIGDFGYGAGFWLMNRSDGVPPDTFAAFGNRGQYVVIVPSRNIVIVRRGEDPAGARFDIAAFTRDVLAALR